MAFWGVKIEAGGSHTIPTSNPPRRLRLSRGSVMEGTTSLKPWCAVYCSVGASAPVVIFRSDHLNTVRLKVEFEETQDIVFTVRGPRGVHLSGYYVDRIHKVDLPPPLIPDALNPIEMLEKLQSILKNVLENPVVRNKAETIHNSDNVESLENVAHITNISDDNPHALALISPKHTEVPKEVGHESVALDVISDGENETREVTLFPESQPSIDCNPQINYDEKFVNLILPSNVIISAIISKLNEEIESNHIYGGIASYLRFHRGECSIERANNIHKHDFLDNERMHCSGGSNDHNRLKHKKLDKKERMGGDLKEKKLTKRKREHNEMKIISESCNMEPSNTLELEITSEKLKKKKKERKSQPTSDHNHGSDKKRSSSLDDCNLLKPKSTKQKGKIEEATGDMNDDVNKKSCSSVRKHNKTKREHKDSEVVSNDPIESPQVDLSVGKMTSEIGNGKDGESGCKSAAILKKKKKHRNVDAATNEEAEASHKEKKSVKKDRLEEVSNDAVKAEKCKSCGNKLGKAINAAGEGEHHHVSSKSGTRVSSSKKSKESGGVKIEKS